MDKRDKCRICRRAGEKLFLKGDKCNLPTCPVTRRAYKPGQHGSKARRPSRLSDYAIQLSEKQKAKAIYGVGESQLSTYFDRARKVKGATGQTLMNLLESRLDNVVYRAGFARSRYEAKQLASHGNVSVNEKTAKTASMILKKGDKVKVSKVGEKVKRDLPDWLKVKGSEIQVSSEIKYDPEQSIVNEQLIIEYYSR